ncbi:MAG: DUF998 domain-containing protein [Chloroflexi bacterium]|nr:MAG: DUF998 domain-containing protein [Chloroflexota bacterium]
MRWTSLLLTCGIVGPPLFITTFLIEGATRPGYSWWRNYVSSLATSETGWVQIANFLVWGALAIAFSIGVLRAGLTLAGVLFFLFGALLVIAGLFVTDGSLGYPPGAPGEHTVHGAVHGVAGLGVFSDNALVAFVVSRHFSRQPERGWWAAASVIVGAAVIVLFVAATVISVLDEQGVAPNGPTGFVQRTSIVIGFGWIAFVAWRLRRDSSRQAAHIGDQTTTAVLGTSPR